MSAIWLKEMLTQVFLYCTFFFLLNEFLVYWEEWSRLDFKGMFKEKDLTQMSAFRLVLIGFARFMWLGCTLVFFALVLMKIFRV